VRAWLLGAALAAGAAAAQGPAVALQGMLGSKALLLVGGGAPRAVAPGETHQGVKVVSTSGDQAVVEVAGQRHTLRVGEAPASVGHAGPAPGSGRQIVLTAASGGHFVTEGSINGRATRFLVDTGATLVGLSAGEAERLGVDWKSGQPVRMATANGVAPGWRVKLASLRIHDVQVHEVDAVVTQQPMPYVLLGNSFLGRFQMRRDNDQMVLERRF